ncbi:MAG TPA: DUF1015 domain-containing protein [Nitrospiraceae bacterium]|jgi:uncharacterized protein (DUF1015 family)|nr:DUF1015 domain-containing protein [Nitrospiraceae bacterium]
MATIVPLQGTLYNPAVVGDIRHVVAPPYDVIDAATQRALYERHPQNIIRLELGLEEPGDGPTANKYMRAAAWLQDWLRTGALRRDSQPAVYYHTVEYRLPSDEPGGPVRMLKGFLAAAELEEFGTGRIYPHENTRAAAKTDRLNLLEACRANFSPIWSLYSDPEGSIIDLLEQAVRTNKPRIEFHDDAGFRQRLWAVTDPVVLDRLVAAMKPKPLFIADGHHRYETALTYRRLCHERAGASASRIRQPYDSVLMLFAALEDPGLTILPTHRVLTTAVPPLPRLRSLLGDAFEFHPFPVSGADEPAVRRRFLQTLREQGQSATVFGLACRGADAYVLLTLRPQHRPSPPASPRDRLDVSILQQHVIAKLCPTPREQEAVLYTKDDDEALDWVRQGTGEAALLLNPTKVDEVRAVAAAGERMPHKSTYFFPKPLTGLVINVFEEVNS